jgi:hypothetical protein
MDVTTLIEKARYNLRKLPVWMRPEGYREDKHAITMLMKNPENGNIIKGEAAVSSFGRSGTYKSVLFDEFAFWPFAQASWDSAGASTKTRIALSTPYGKNNAYGKIVSKPDLKIVQYPDEDRNHALKMLAFEQEIRKRAA